MGVPRRTVVKIRPSHPELGVMLPNPPADLRTSPARVWSGICTVIKYVVFFCLGMVVGAVFLQSDNVQKGCFESMVAVGFSTHRSREICYKNQPSYSNGPLTRFDCMPRNANAQDCKKRGCLWDESVQNVPYCYYPDKYGSYSNMNVTAQNGKISAFMQRKIKSQYPEDIDLLQFEACSETESRLHIKITDAKRDRYEPHYPEVPQVQCKSFEKSKFQVKISENKMGFKVLRSPNNVIFDSEDIGALIYANQFLQVTARFPSGSLLYGIGERQSPMNIKTSTYQSFTLWNRDVAPTDKVNLYGSHPFLLIRDKFDGTKSKWHGLFLLNSNAMDIITQPGPSITFRTIGGILDFYWFMGDTPSQVTEQYLEVVGLPRMPPYWALGFHLCKFGYGSLEKTIQVWNRTRSADIPFDVQWNDLDYMDRNNDFTIGPKFSKLSDFVDMLHSIGMHYIPLIDPGVSAGEKAGQYEPYDYGLELGIFVNDEKNKPFVGKVWNGISTVWPDFTNPKTLDYWTLMLQKLHRQVPFDGAWIDMNEPSNFYSGTIKGCPKNSLNYPPYVPNVIGGQLFSKTLCPSAKHYSGSHYDLHNMYGISEAVFTSFALMKIRNEKRPVTISRSTFPGHGHFASHWTGDVFSTWSDMKLSVAQTLNFNMFGIPFVGADICGFNGNTTAELCARWSQLGAFYPFSRNHNSDDTIEQDPVSLGPSVVNAARKALRIRYSLLPYLYSLFYDAHKRGTTVARPLFYEFPNDGNTHLLETEFMWGSCILIVPVLDEGKTSVDGYFPAGIWYDWNTNKTVRALKPLTQTINAPLDVIPLFARGGCILPSQVPKATTTESRLTPLTLRAYLDVNGIGSGKAYFDDGDYVYSIDEGKYSLINFTVTEKTFTSRVVKSGFPAVPPLKTVLIHGECGKVSGVTVNGQKWSNFNFDTSSCILSIEVDLNLLEEIKLTWHTSSMEN
ncbi:lysosomal alpha-glucosidase [Frankliniella occidentalis]|uniref:Lysosomal alpha-glucosidase n=1 Tax=Frankliniella occidentalis TaxID=133901 RepID=A0A6J1TGT3_FRAOC|nr:lysosomal alpha-glucosidase [Frankliniella occidentalis]